MVITGIASLTIVDRSSDSSGINVESPFGVYYFTTPPP